MTVLRRFSITIALTASLWGCSDSTTRPRPNVVPDTLTGAVDTFTIDVLDSLRSFPNPRGVCFVNEQRGVVVTYEGRIGLTVDGGHTWEARESHTNQPLYAVCFASGLVGYAVGGVYQDGVFLKTTDGGASWARLTAPAGSELQAVHFVDESRGYVVGLTGTISFTPDGGQTWIDQYPFEGLLNDVFFVDEETGFACGIQATILMTTDGGQEWTDISPPNIGTFVQRIDFEQGIGIAAAGNRILRAGDGGRTWAPIHEMIGWINDSVVVDANVLVAVGDGAFVDEIPYSAIHVTLDGGDTWITDDKTWLSCTDLQRVNSNLVVGVGGNRLIKIHFH